MAEINTIARPYAKAAFLYAKEHHCLNEWTSFLQALSALTSSEDVLRFIDEPTIDSDKKNNFLQELLKNVLKRPVSQQEANFIALLIKEKRLEAVGAIQKEYEFFNLKDKKIMPIDIISAYPMSQEQLSLFKETLQKYFNSEIEMTVKIDESLLAGAVIKSGDQIIDGSVKGRFEKLAENLKYAI